MNAFHTVYGYTKPLKPLWLRGFQQMYTVAVRAKTALAKKRKNTMTDKTSIKVQMPKGFKQIIRAAARDRGVTVGAFVKMAIAHELESIGTVYCDPEGEVAAAASL
jgi:hypothetical protein